MSSASVVGWHNMLPHVKAGIPVEAHIAQSVEHFLGKEEVIGSSPIMSSIFVGGCCIAQLLPFVVVARPAGAVRGDVSMAKEKFERNKPHVNVGTITSPPSGCLILSIAIVSRLAEEPELTKTLYLTPSHFDHAVSNFRTFVD